MTSTTSVLAALSIILIDLLGRAALDKVLAFSGDPTLVALWAQLQSVVELVSSVALAGVLQGLTVLIAQTHAAHDERSLLRASLKLALGSALAVALLSMLLTTLLSTQLSRARIATDLFWLAALSGCIAVLPATLNAYWLGKHQQQRMLRLALLSGAILLAVAASAWLGLSLRALVWMQCAVLAGIAALVWRHLRRLMHGHADPPLGAQPFRQLLRFVPVGLSIGIMSPVSMLLVRGMLAETLSWDEVGFMQALWRSSEWVTTTAAGVLSLVFLPRFSHTYDSTFFKQEMLRAAALVLLPAACLLLLIYANQRTLLTMLYDARFVVSDAAVAWFMLGCWVRIASWLFLFGLFAAQRTRLIMAGEMLSLPLYALLLWVFSAGMTLERSALLYLLSYLIYLCFNLAGLACASRPARGCTATVIKSTFQP